ncbi:hypothetical protein TNCV_1456671 [Trichonephila clavipes]|nr:hypothetical protein TNCV_1456671 [Trichonephila clavipes]
MSSTSLDHGSTLRGPSPKALVLLNSVTLIFPHSLSGPSDTQFETPQPRQKLNPGTSYFNPGIGKKTLGSRDPGAANPNLNIQKAIQFTEELKLPQTKILFSANLYGAFHFLPSLILLKLLLFTTLISLSPRQNTPHPETNDEEDFERNDQWQKGNQDKVAKWREVQAQGGVRRGGLSGNSCRKSSARLP